MSVLVRILVFAIFVRGRGKMNKTMKKKLTADNCKSALNIALLAVQGYLSLTEKDFAKDDTIIDANNTGKAHPI